ncbi:MAG: hypothetical protein M3680_25560 [Myxococcota bacterium]|nr:hypothetical protein [Myxococcota bacterium]
MRLAIVVMLALAACHPPGWDKGGDDDPDAGPRADAMADAAGDAAALTCEKVFRLDGHAGATSVWVTGDFVAWGGNPGAGAVELAMDGSGVWLGTRTFEAGSYQYKLILDGSSWIMDPANPNVVDDGFGGQNSVYSCAP